MIKADKRHAVFLLHQEGMSPSEMARRLHINRNTVRSLIAQKGDMPVRVRKDKIRVDAELLQRLYQECEGRAERLHKKLVEEHAVRVGYSTLRRMLCEMGLKRSRGPHGERVAAEPGVEMQRQTTLDMQQAQPHLPRSVVAAREWLAEITYGWRPRKLFQTEPKDRRELGTLLDFARNGILRDRKKAATILARKAGWPNRTIAKILHAPLSYIMRYFKLYSQSGLKGLFGPKTPRPSTVWSRIPDGAS
jgi:transposase